MCVCVCVDHLLRNRMPPKSSTMRARVCLRVCVYVCMCVYMCVRALCAPELTDRRACVCACVCERKERGRGWETHTHTELGRIVEPETIVVGCVTLTHTRTHKWI